MKSSQGVGGLTATTKGIAQHLDTARNLGDAIALHEGIGDANRGQV